MKLFPSVTPKPSPAPPLPHTLRRSHTHRAVVRMSLSPITCTTIPTSSESSNTNFSGDLEPIFKQKKTIRSEVRKALREMDPCQRSVEDNAIQNIVLEAPWFKSSRRLCAYISCSALREVDTSRVLAEILHSPAKVADNLEQHMKRLYVPRVEDKNSHMRMFKISSIDDLIPNSMNILEPAPVDSSGNHREDVMQASEPVDLLLLPGLAFDKSGRRLGRGGGYYDTFLSNYQKLADEKNWKQPLRVALSYSLQILDNDVIPITPNDVYIDALVTPTGMIPISPSALHRVVPKQLNLEEIENGLQ